VPPSFRVIVFGLLALGNGRNIKTILRYKVQKNTTAGD